jgi:translation initiation factor IF-3
MFSYRRVLLGVLPKASPVVRVAVATAPRLQSTRAPVIFFQAFSTIVKNLKSQHKAPPSDVVIKNERINFPTMRVVYPALTGGNEWKIMTRAEALKFATEREADLVVGKWLLGCLFSFVCCEVSYSKLRNCIVNASSDPPVCKIDVSKQKRADQPPKEKEVRGPSKARTLKEMFMTGGIEQRDFNMKMKKVTEFLTKGHPVKVSIVPKKFLKNNRFTKDGVKRDRMQGNCCCCAADESCSSGMGLVVTRSALLNSL